MIHKLCVLLERDLAGEDHEKLRDCTVTSPAISSGSKADLQGLDVVSVLELAAIHIWVVGQRAALVYEAGLMLGFILLCMLLPLQKAPCILGSLLPGCMQC